MSVSHEDRGADVAPTDFRVKRSWQPMLNVLELGHRVGRSDSVRAGEPFHR